jgi:putative sporulation protein YyaC
MFKLLNPNLIHLCLSGLVSGGRLPVVLCIGSDRVTGDCFGPLVGEYLTKLHNVDAFVYGKLSSPVTALNLTETVRFIKLRHPHSPILAVDSALGREKDKGTFRVFPGGLKPGAATGKTLPSVGDYSLTLTVASIDSGELNGVRLGFIEPLASYAASEIARHLNSLNALKAAL